VSVSAAELGEIGRSGSLSTRLTRYRPACSTIINSSLQT